MQRYLSTGLVRDQMSESSADAIVSRNWTQFRPAKTTNDRNFGRNFVPKNSENVFRSESGNRVRLVLG